MAKEYQLMRKESNLKGPDLTLLPEIVSGGIKINTRKYITKSIEKR
jgi:hypothetical protein